MTKKKTKKKELNAKKIAIISLIVTVIILTITLVMTIMDERREPVSEVLILENIKKNESKVVLNYSTYKKFLKEHDIKGNLKSANFRTSNYILVVGEFSKKDKITDVSLSSTTGVNVQIEKQDDKKEKLAYFIPVPKNKEIAGLSVKVNEGE